MDDYDNDGNTPGKLNINILWDFNLSSSLNIAHLAAMEGNLHCLKYILSNSANTNSLIAARNDQVCCLIQFQTNSIHIQIVLNFKGDTPKTLAQQFYKDEVVEYLEAVEWDRDHPEQAESIIELLLLIKLKLNIILFKDLAFPAHVAAFNGDLDHIKLLVEQGVININERDDKGSTIAHKGNFNSNFRKCFNFSWWFKT